MHTECHQRLASFKQKQQKNDPPKAHDWFYKPNCEIVGMCCEMKGQQNGIISQKPTFDSQWNTVNIFNV